MTTAAASSGTSSTSVRTVRASRSASACIPTGQGAGLGQSFVEAGLEYARGRYAPDEFSLSVAAFNRRAITVYERVGFVRSRAYMHRTGGREWEFIEMRRRA